MSTERFLELLPWYVNGTLSDEDRAWVDAWMASHPTAAAQLEWHRALRTHVRESVPEVPETIGLERAMARIAAEKASIGRAEAARAEDAARRPQPATARRGGEPSLLARLRDWLGSANLAPALGAACALVVVQGIVIGTMVGRDAPAPVEYRSLGPSATETGPLLRVNFRADARESDLRMLLVEVGGTLAGGPGQIGDWYVRVAPGARERALETLKASALVEAVEAVDALPPRQ